MKPDTANLYAQIVRTHIKPAFGAIKLQALQAPTIQKLYNQMQHDGLSAKTIKNVHGVLTRALSQAFTLGFIPSNPATLCARTLPRVERPEMQPLDMPEASTFLDALDGHRFKLLYSVAMLCGMREGELLGLQWRCVDFERGTIQVDKQLLWPRRKGDGFRFGSPKNGKERTITPAPSVMAMLKEQKSLQNRHRMQAGPAWHNGQFSGLVFTDEVADPKAVQMTLGHATVAFTLDRYAHFTETMQRHSAAQMEALYQKL